MDVRGLFPSDRKHLTATDVVVDGLDVYTLKNGLAGTRIAYMSGKAAGGKSQLTVTTDLVKSKVVSTISTRLEGLHIEGETWIAGGHGGLYRSTDGGETWLMEKLPIDEQITSIVRHDGSLWVAGVEGTIATDRGGWKSVDRPKAPKFDGAGYGTSLPYPDVGLSRLKIVDGTLYALGHGLWRLDAKGAHLELSSKNLIVDLAQTAEGTLVAVGVSGTAFRRKGKRWAPIAAGTLTYVGVVPLAEGILLVATEGKAPLRWSTDDGTSFDKLPGAEIDVGEGRLHTAVPDGHGGALVSGWNGLLFRVAKDGLGPWMTRPRQPVGPKTRRDTKAIARPVHAEPRVTREFHEAILATPDDDAPRLVYADWLTERGDPRGEFIQIQCILGHELFGAKGRIWSAEEHMGKERPDHLTLQKAEMALFKKHAATWIAPIREYFYQWGWRRGFLQSITVNASFFPGAKEVFASHPIRELKFTGLDKLGLTQVAALPMESVRWLNLAEQRIDPTLVHTLLGENLANIETLLLWNNPLGDEGVVKLATQSHLHKLRELSLLDCKFGDEGLEAIASSPSFANLELLNIRDSNVTADGVMLLAKSKTLKKLQHVKVAWKPSGKLLAAVTALEARLVPGWDGRRWEPYC